jgi:transcriptional regulator of arginine metabolism
MQVPRYYYSLNRSVLRHVTLRSAYRYGSNRIIRVMDDRTATSAHGSKRPQSSRAAPQSSRAAKKDRLRLIRELVASQPVASQHELVDILARRGHDVTQATVSRDIAELGLVKIAHNGRPVYASPDDLAPAPPLASDARLRRVLADYPVNVGRSGLTLLLVSQAGTAGAIGQAIDESTLDESWSCPSSPPELW